MVPTSQIPFISSTHGAERRNQRNISKRDLQAAVKYGTCQEGYPRKNGEPTWRFTHANIVHITSDTKQREITSWVEQLPFEIVNISPRMQKQYDESKKRNAEEPSLITSHTVFIIDKSSSMRESDIDGHRTRSRGAYYNLAEEYVSNQLHPWTRDTLGGNNIRHTDVISIVEMRSEPALVLYYEPISWILYNKLVELASIGDVRISNCSGHGNYYESIQTALCLLARNDHSKLALSLYFFTDGRPSDFNDQEGRVAHSSPEKILNLLRQFAVRYKERFSFHAFGLGTNVFDVLEQMVAVVRAAGALAKFGNGGRDLLALCDSLTSIVASTTSMTSMMSRIHTKTETRATSAVEKEEYDPRAPFDRRDWNFFNMTEKDCEVIRSELKYVWAHGKWGPQWEDKPLFAPDANGFAVKKKFFEKGAERIVFEMMEINAMGNPVGPQLVAKDSKFLVKYARTKFHEVFVRTQMKAANLAQKFNAKLDHKGIDRLIPRIQFLPCCIYNCNMASTVYLAEKRLNPERYKKWNDNTGRIDGIMRANLTYAPEPIPKRITEFAAGGLSTFQEEGEDEDYEDEDETGELLPRTYLKSEEDARLEERILDVDILQAFSHWTYVYTKRSVLVCDLQGELTFTGAEPFFELTDPCIHSILRDESMGYKGFGR